MEPCIGGTVLSAPRRIFMARKAKKRRYSKSSGKEVESEMRRY
jgi:hypothetical protein